MGREVKVTVVCVARVSAAVPRGARRRSQEMGGVRWSGDMMG
jgi:hypothetical protein